MIDKGIRLMLFPQNKAFPTCTTPTVTRIVKLSVSLDFEGKDFRKIALHPRASS